MKIRIFLPLFMILILLSSSVLAGSLESIFNSANSDFEKGDYASAQSKYKQLEKLGVYSETLFYNRAVTEARLGNIGRAVLYFEKVLINNPGDESAAFNIKVLRDYIARRSNELGRDADLAPAAGPWRATLDRFSATSASISFLVFFLLFFAVIGLIRFVKSDIIGLSLRVAAGIFAISALLLGAVTLGKRNQLLHIKEAIVVSVNDNYQLDVYDGPGENAKRFFLEEGSRVKMLDSRHGWVKIQDDHGRDGWVKKSSIGRI